ncbi:MAG: hypothetical protein JXR91_08375 [Deltaproteobacteria bacterium]|nr:hypothetical protein [Deltaproteobacteria bacterium]
MFKLIKLSVSFIILILFLLMAAGCTSLRQTKSIMDEYNIKIHPSPSGTRNIPVTAEDGSRIQNNFPEIKGTPFFLVIRGQI